MGDTFTSSPGPILDVTDISTEKTVECLSLYSLHVLLFFFHSEQSSIFEGNVRFKCVFSWIRLYSHSRQPGEGGASKLWLEFLNRTSFARHLKPKVRQSLSYETASCFLCHDLFFFSMSTSLARLQTRSDTFGTNM